MKPHIYYGIIPKSKIKNIPLEFQKSKLRLETKQGFAFLYYLLEKLGIQVGSLAKDKYGKPYFEEGHIHFNYAHSKDYIACVLGEIEVGIDIEQKERKISDLVAKNVLSLEADTKERVRQWVHKEAYAKLVGKGLGLNLKTLDLKDIQELSYEIEGEDYWAAIYTYEKNVVFEELDYEGNV